MHEDQRPVTAQGRCRDAAVLDRRHLRAEQRLSEESAVSVQEAALAVVHHGIRYLPVVDDGVLVGIVAVRWLSRCRRPAVAVVQDGDRSAASRAPGGPATPAAPRPVYDRASDGGEHTPPPSTVDLAPIVGVATPVAGPSAPARGDRRRARRT
jgi:hypothetical protein